MKRVCVFSGSSPGSRPEYGAAARELGRLLVEQNLQVVYGGANVGLMGALADAVLEAGGTVVGVIPRGLIHKEVAHKRLTELHVVSSMHERKTKMEALSDAFVALPGGFGTLEETLEILTWGQLGIHTKPCGLLNVAGYYDPLLEFLNHACAEQFLRPQHRDMLCVATTPDALLIQLHSYQPPTSEKWIDRADT